jgi:hypothetical protein
MSTKELIESPLVRFENLLSEYEAGLQAAMEQAGATPGRLEHLEHLKSMADLLGVVLVDGDGLEIFATLERMDTDIDILAELQAKMRDVLDGWEEMHDWL